MNEIKIGSAWQRQGKFALKFGFYNDQSCRAIRFDIYGRDNIDLFCAKPIEVCKADLYNRQPPLLDINEQEAQNMMDSLWSIGIRPTNREGSVG